MNRIQRAGPLTMTMRPRLRKFVLTVHIMCSVGWLGAVIGSLALAVAGLTSRDAQVVRAAYLTLELIGWFVLVPLSLASLLTGLVQSLGTRWGLFRHYWVVGKLMINVFATVVLLIYIPFSFCTRSSSCLLYIFALRIAKPFSLFCACERSDVTCTESFVGL